MTDASRTTLFPSSVGQLRYWTTLAVLAAASSCIQLLEAPLPRMLPWLKPGLSNALVLYGMVTISWRFAFGIVFLRTILTGMFLGTLFSPPSLLSFAGGFAAVLSMWVGLSLSRWGLGLSGVSVLGALANNIAQLLVVDIWFSGHFPLSFHLLAMIWISIPSGIVVARLTLELIRRTT